VRWGWIVNGQRQEVWIHQKGLHPAIGDLSLALGAMAISAGSFGYRGMAKSTVYTPLCNPSPVYDHYILRLSYSVAHSLPHGLGHPHPRNAHVFRPPGHPARDLTTTSLNSHVICTDPQLLIGERPEAYKPIQGVVDDVDEKRIPDCVEAICGIQGWGSDGKRVECQGTREGEGCVDSGVGVFGNGVMGVLLLWKRRSELRTM